MYRGTGDLSGGPTGSPSENSKTPIDELEKDLGVVVEAGDELSKNQDRTGGQTEKKEVMKENQDVTEQLINLEQRLRYKARLDHATVNILQGVRENEDLEGFNKLFIRIHSSAVGNLVRGDVDKAVKVLDIYEGLLASSTPDEHFLSELLDYGDDILPGSEKIAGWFSRFWETKEEQISEARANIHALKLELIEAGNIQIDEQTIDEAPKFTKEQLEEDLKDAIEDKFGKLSWGARFALGIAINMGGLTEVGDDGMPLHPEIHDFIKKPNIWSLVKFGFKNFFSFGFFKTKKKTPEQVKKTITKKLTDYETPLAVAHFEEHGNEEIFSQDLLFMRVHTTKEEATVQIGASEYHFFTDPESDKTADIREADIVETDDGEHMIQLLVSGKVYEEPIEGFSKRHNIDPYTPPKLIEISDGLFLKKVHEEKDKSGLRELGKRVVESVS